MQIEDYSMHIESVGATGASHYEYVVEMVIQPQ